MFVLSVCQSVGLLEMSMYFGRMAETTEIPFGVGGRVGPGKKNMY